MSDLNYYPKKIDTNIISHKKPFHNHDNGFKPINKNYSLFDRKTDYSSMNNNNIYSNISDNFEKNQLYNQLERKSNGGYNYEPNIYPAQKLENINLLQKEIEQIRTVQKKNVVVVLDESHLLSKETLEEFRFLLNSQYDSVSPLSLILVGQKELWDQKLRMQSYTAIRQRIDMNIILKQLDRAETGRYIAAHLAYAGGGQDIFTPGAEDEIYKVSSGVPRMINRICEKSLMYSSQQKKKLIDEHVVNYVAEHEMAGGA